MISVVIGDWPCFLDGLTVFKLAVGERDLIEDSYSPRSVHRNTMCVYPRFIQIDHFTCFCPFVPIMSLETLAHVLNDPPVSTYEVEADQNHETEDHSPDDWDEIQCSTIPLDPAVEQAVICCSKEVGDGTDRAYRL